MEEELEPFQLGVAARISNMDYATGLAGEATEQSVLSVGRVSNPMAVGSVPFPKTAPMARSKMLASATVAAVTVSAAQVLFVGRDVKERTM